MPITGELNYQSSMYVFAEPWAKHFDGDFMEESINIFTLSLLPASLFLRSFYVGVAILDNWLILF